MLNRVEFIGNLTKDIELRQTATGKSVTNLDIALNYYVQNEKRTEYVQVSAWDKQADDAAKYLSKGRQVYVEAKVSIRKRTLEGKNIPFPEFHALRVMYLGPANNQNGNGQPNPNDYDGSNFGYDQQDPGHFGSSYGDTTFNQPSNNNNRYPDSPFGR